MKQISAKPALIAATVFVFSCAECDGGIEAAHAKLGRPSTPATAIGTTQRKRGGVGDRVAPRKTSAQVTGKLSRRQSAVNHGQKAHLVAHAVGRKTIDRHTSSAQPSKKETAMLGLASFYSDDRETASGERFDRHRLSAAHPSLPFGTRLRVTNVRNGRSVTVRVNDRGPFVHGRVIDVTSAAAEALGMVDVGVAKVTLDIVR